MKTYAGDKVQPHVSNKAHHLSSNIACPPRQWDVHEMGLLKKVSQELTEKVLQVNPELFIQFYLDQHLESVAYWRQWLDYLIGHVKDT